MTRNRDTYLHGRMRFEHNVAFNNGFGGVVYHKTNRGELQGNIVFMNGAYPGTSNYTGLTVNGVEDLIISSNIVWARDANDYGIKKNGDATLVVTMDNFVVGKTQFGEGDENTFMSFDEAPALDTIFTRALDISAIQPDPHQRTGDAAPQEIDGVIKELELDFTIVDGALSSP